MKEASEPLIVDRALVARATTGLAVLLAAAWLCGVLLEEHIETLGAAFIERFGAAGLFVGVIVTDTSPLPMTNEPLALLAIGAGWSVLRVFCIVSVASVTAGSVGYGAGRLVGRTAVGAWLERRHPRFPAFMRRWGAQGVAIAALLPIPYALATWSAGIARIGWWKVALASLLRIPKTAFYVAVLAGGWALGAG